MMRTVAILFCACAALLSSCGGDSAPAPKAPRYGVMADTAMVVTAHPEATRIGLDVLRSGGNAVDAAVAVQFALCVSFPYAGNIGGGGFMVLRMADGQATTLDFREKAPAAASRDMYLDSAGNVVPRLSSRGHLSAGVPGSVDGMVRAHAQYGTLPWARLVQPAIDLAEGGYVVTAHQADWLNKQKEEFQQYNPDSSYYLVKPGDLQWQEGERIVQPDLAATLKRIRDQGRAGFYEGETAALLLDEMRRGRGIITQADLDAYAAQWRAPVTGEYDDYRILSMGPPSSGGIVLLQMLGMVEEAPLDQWGLSDPRTYHRMVEAERRAFADRAEFLADPDYWDVPTEALLDEEYARRRMTSFDPAKAGDSDATGHGEPLKEGTETTHYSILDPMGNAVSITTTINSPYGSKVWVKGGGFLLNNEMDDFSAKPGVPNIYGLVGNEANAICAGKRMLSSMTPTIIEKEGKVFMIVGTPGGSTIITSVFQCFLDVAEHGMTMQEAVDRPRFHHQWLPDKISIEPGALPWHVYAALSAIGHAIEPRGPIGRVDAILVHPDGRLEGAADPRRDDTAMGW